MKFKNIRISEKTFDALKRFGYPPQSIIIAEYEGFYQRDIEEDKTQNNYQGDNYNKGILL